MKINLNINYFTYFLKGVVLLVRKHKLVSVVSILLAVSLFVAVFLLFSVNGESGRQSAAVASKNPVIAKMKQAKERNPKLYEKMEIRETGPCKNAFEVIMPDGSTPEDSPALCTGYDDQVARLDDPVQVYRGLLQKPVECIGDGKSGRRVQAVYAYISGQENKLAKDRSQFDLYAERVNSIFNTTSSQHSYGATVRWATNANCDIDIATVVLPVGFSGYYEMINEIYKQIGVKSDRNYLVWVDASVGVCGLGSWRDDTNSDPASNNNNRYAGFARVDRNCWGGHTETHELLHTFGAVSRSAPNSDGAAHCTDENDVMCYGPNTRLVCQIEANNNQIVDCNNDDYFHPSPPSDSYLATHWNTARSYALQIARNKDSTPPSVPTSINLSRKVFNIYLNWNESSDAQSGISHYRIYRLNTTDTTYSMSNFKFVTNTQNNYYNFWDSDSYYSQKRYVNYFYIVAVDKEGNVSGPSTVASIDPPNPWPIAEDVGPTPTPPIVKTPQPPELPKTAPTIIDLRSYDITKSSFKIKWTYSGDETQIKAVNVYLNDALYTGFPRQDTMQLVPSLAGGVYQVTVKLTRTNGTIHSAGPITVTTLDYFDPSVIANHKPYDLEVTGKDENYYYISATFNTTGSPAYKHTLNVNGAISGAQWYLTPLNYPRTVNFKSPISETVASTSFSISVWDKDNNFLIQSDSIPNPFL